MFKWSNKNSKEVFVLFRKSGDLEICPKRVSNLLFDRGQKMTGGGGYYTRR